LRKAFEYVAWTGLLTALLGPVNLGEAAEPVRARVSDEASATAGTGSARQLYTAGRELYLQERYAEAVSAFEAAASGESDLNDAEQERLQNYLRRARVKAGSAVPAADVVARGQSDDQPAAAPAVRPSKAPSESDARKMLGQARQQFNGGQVNEAEKTAQTCRKLPVRWKLFGDNPEKLLEEIKECRKQETAWKNDSSSTESRKQRSNYLLGRARQVLEEGDAANADRLVREAEQIKVKRGLADLKPEQLRQQLARKPVSNRKAPSAVVQADAVQPAGARQRDIRQVVADEDDSLSLPLDAGGENSPPIIGKSSPPKAAAAKGSTDQAQARQLLQQAQELLEAGRTDEARAKVQQAEKLDVAYDDALALTPEYLTAMIERAERDGILAKKDNKSTRPGVAARPDGGAQVAAARREAKSLTNEAQSDLEAGRLEDARAKAAKARDIDVAYDLLDKTPEDVMDQAAQMQDKRYLAKRASRSAAEPAADSAGEPGAEPALEDVPEMNAAEIARTEGAGENEIEDAAVVSPNGLTALDYYQRGRQAIKSGNSELATRCYLQAFQSGEKLDGRKMQEIQDYLALHNGKGKKIQLLGTRTVPESELAAAPGEEPLPRRIDQVDEQRQIALDKLRTEVRNAEFRAERLAGTNPEAALEMIDKAQSSVERSGLAAPMTAQLLKSLAKSRESIEYNRKINEPRIAQEKRNEEVRSAVKRDTANKVRIEQDFAEKVDKYNELLKQKRFDEAIVLAKEARLLQPENPVSEVMVLKAKFAKQEDFNKNLKERKDDLFTEQLNDVDKAALGYVEFIEYPKNWKELTKRRDHLKRPGSRTPSSEELKIERSLSRDVSLHFENAPLAEVIKRLASLAEVNIVLDPSGLEDEGITTNTSVSINIDGIRLKSALNLLLEPLRLGYTIKDDVLKVTSRMKQQGELLTVNYSVADLVVPIRDFGPGQGSQGMQSSGFNMGNLAYPGSSPGQMNVTSTGGLSRPAGQAFAQVEDRDGLRRTGNAAASFGGGLESAGTHGGGVQADFNSLMNLITTTVQPDSWEELSGPGSVMPYRTTLSLVIRQTQAVHEEIADLLGQLRRLQDLQVTVECRFITVSDNFFERIGVDFNFNLPTNVSNGLTNTFGQPLPPFGAGQVFPTTTTGTATSGTTTSGTTTSGTTTSGTTTSGTTGGGTGPFTPGPVLDTTNYQHWPRYGAIAGLNAPAKTFTSDLSIPFRQGSFTAGIPQFGGFDANVGLNVGFAILSDIETFFVINASQGDKRNNLLFAPKITLFNGQIATVTDTVQRPFVTSLIPTVGFFSVGFQPQITVLPEGVQMTVQAVISADRRYVRLTVIPSFTAITDVQQFSFIGAAGGSTTTGSSTAGGGGQNAFGGGFGQTGFGGIGGVAAVGVSTSGASTSGTSTSGATGIASDQQITIQQPVFEIVSVATTVSVPDGGTVLLGGIKRLREGRVMNGVPILNKLPYISRLFKNTAVGRETESLMLMVTPRIIIQEEEEQLLGVELPPR
jgi:general secretion pathway protein D